MNDQVTLAQPIRAERFLHSCVGDPGAYCRTICMICGEITDKDNIRMILCDGRTELGILCPACVEAGPRGAAERACQAADDLCEQSEALNDLAMELRTLNPLCWCPLALLHGARAQRDAEIEYWQKACDAHRAEATAARYQELVTAARRGPLPLSEEDILDAVRMVVIPIDASSANAPPDIVTIMDALRLREGEFVCGLVWERLVARLEEKIAQRQAANKQAG